MEEKRRYIRMSTVFPVEFRVLHGNGSAQHSRLLQGFARDVSEGGMCIEFKSFGRETESTLHAAGIQLDLTINPPFSSHPIKARAKIVWLQKESEPHPAKYLIGVFYQDIDPAARRRLIGHARRMRWMPRIAAFLAVALVAGAGALYYRNQELAAENRALVRNLVESADKKSRVASDLTGLQTRKNTLETELQLSRAKNKRLEGALAAMNQEVTQLNAESSKLSEQSANQKIDFERQLAESLEREKAIRLELESIRAGQDALRLSYQNLEEAGREGAEAVLSQMYRWLLSHQNLRTGLVASFEGDAKLEDVAYTYDQALVIQAFLLFGDEKNAADILAFFDKRAEREGGAFFNAYDTVGGAPQERVVHSGPNFWLGIAALQYESRVGGGRFLDLARHIGDWAIDLQDAEGGVPGGPRFTWYSTEHNLDAYAFFNMLAARFSETKYAEAREKSLAWLKKYAYSAKERRLNRGKGDATIATDTFGWAVAAIGPAALNRLEFDPEGILDFAEKNCGVTVSFQGEGGRTHEVRGFDFAKAQNIGRGGVISTEWTAQMVVSFQILADYFKNQGDLEKASKYREKADLYLSELQKMLITSPSRTGQGRGCLPYASAENVETGHGWRTPHGASTGSVAATAYGIFAWKGYNPFDTQEGKEASHADL